MSTADLPLFARPYSGAPPSQRRSDTSQAAAASIAPVMGNLQLRVLHFIEDRGPFGATLEEIVEGTGIKLQTCCARRRELELMGLIVDTGIRRVNSSGRKAAAWRAK